MSFGWPCIKYQIPVGKLRSGPPTWSSASYLWHKEIHHDLWTSWKSGSLRHSKLSINGLVRSRENHHRKPTIMFPLDLGFSCQIPLIFPIKPRFSCKCSLKPVPWVEIFGPHLFDRGHQRLHAMWTGLPPSGRTKSPGKKTPRMALLITEICPSWGSSKIHI